MVKNVKISMNQFGVLVFLYTIGSTILLTPSGLASMAKQDAWISAIIGAVLSVLIVYLYCSLALLYPKLSLIEYSEKILGKWLGKIVSLSFLFFCFIGATTVLYHTGDFLIAQLYPETPLVMINIMIALPVMFGIILGLEVMARTGQIFLPWIFLLFFFMVLATSPQLEFKNIVPVFEHGPVPILQGALLYTGTAALPCIVFTMVIPHIEKKQELRKTFIRSIILGGLVVILVTFLCLVVLGPDITSMSVFPSYILAREINIGDFLQRIEVIVAIMWFITIYYKSMFYFYSFVVGLSQFFKLKDYRPTVLPLTIILVTYSCIVYPNNAYAASWDTEAWVPFAIFNGLLIPLLLFIVGKIRIKVKKKQSSTYPLSDQFTE